MTDQRQLDRALDAFLAEGPESVSDHAVMRALDAVDRTKQRRDLLAPWRFNLMITLPRLASIALVAVLVMGVVALVAGQHPSVGSNGATPTPPNPSPTAAAAAPTGDLGMVLDTATWTTFDASRYGYTVGWPNTPVRIHAPATEDWAGQTSAAMWDSPTNAPWVDKFYDQATATTMTAVATTIPAGSSEEAFIDVYEQHSPTNTSSCVDLAKDMQQITIDGHPARETTKCNGQAGFVAIGRTMYVFEISAQNQVPFLNAYLSTVKLPVDTTSWIPFVSKIYGFTVAHPAGWTVVAASAHWTLAKPADAAEDTLSSPTDPPSSDTGAPYLMVFEVKIPAGTTADSFLQAYTQLAHGSSDCYPTGPLPKTTIDGHAATLAYTGCNSLYYGAEATVVIGNRIWIFDLRGPDRSAILPFLSTVKIDPSKVID